MQIIVVLEPLLILAVRALPFAVLIFLVTELVQWRRVEMSKFRAVLRVVLGVLLFIFYALQIVQGEELFPPVMYFINGHGVPLFVPALANNICLALLGAYFTFEGIRGINRERKGIGSTSGEVRLRRALVVLLLFAFSSIVLFFIYELGGFQ
jgi:hypothetical protein